MTDKHVEPYGYVYEDTVRTCGGRRSHRQLRFSKTRLNISEDDISEFDITETPVYTHPPQMRALGTTPTEAPPVESQAAEINVDKIAKAIVLAACELDDTPDPDDDDTILITVQDLEAVAHRHITVALERAALAAEGSAE